MKGKHTDLVVVVEEEVERWNPECQKEKKINNVT
jgi:hypothetical protein